VAETLARWNDRPRRHGDLTTSGGAFTLSGPNGYSGRTTISGFTLDPSNSGTSVFEITSPL
jgi:hypothetical protein